MSQRTRHELSAAWQALEKQRVITVPAIREILVLTRVLLEGGEELRKVFPVLYLYCDWSLHPTIHKNEVAREALHAISMAFTQASQRMKFAADPHSYFSAAMDAIAPHELRRQWLEFNLSQQISAHALEHIDGWLETRRMLYESLLDRPLTLGDPGADGRPTVSKNAKQFDVMLQRSGGEPRLVPWSIAISRGADLIEPPPSSTTGPAADHMRAIVAGYCWTVQTVPGTHHVILITEDEPPTAFRHT